jgi:hypothetical protein
MHIIAILHLALADERDREEAVAPPPCLDQLRSASSQLRVMRCAAESRVMSRSSGCERAGISRDRLRPAPRPASLRSVSD